MAATRIRGSSHRKTGPADRWAGDAAKSTDGLGAGMSSLSATLCEHRLWGEPDGLQCTRRDPHEPGRGCRYENGSWVDDSSRDDGGHG